MLKMLQPKALNAWDHELADEIRAGVQFRGIFVPADEAWRQQVDTIGHDLPAEMSSHFRRAMFTTHVQRAVASCFLQLTHDRPLKDRGYARVQLEKPIEVELCKSIAHSWKLTPRIHSLLGIRQALVDRTAALYDSVDRPHSLRSLLEECQLQTTPAVLQATSAFDMCTARFEGTWCLLFDELEIAPIEIQEMLFRSLRSSDQSLVFKLAMSPSTKAAELFKEVTGPSPGNDFEEITLYADPKEGSVFCESLWSHLTKGTPAEHIAPWAVFRRSAFHDPDAPSPYSRRGRWQIASSSLALKDPSYVSFMNHYRIDPDNLEKVSAQQRDAVLRKIGPIVGFRDFMLKPSRIAAQAPKLRKDKARPAALYSGWEALCLISEANPRWFMGIAKSLLINRQSTVSRARAVAGDSVRSPHIGGRKVSCLHLDDTEYIKRFIV
ncbi:hypothetical protein H8R02_29895 [Ramlibacter sp. GTP1]|uniref:Uncharacterized protein n=1 Tax=Ramlibacter albus TaxID=2079448 RepID=A0A923S5N2_9BURK|nr:hypothetical protein [Ramlibacter albus]MBC5768711.1 hypothetical protein [Ramlibacter albus]